MSYKSKRYLANATCGVIILLGLVIITKQLIDYKSYKMNEVLRCLAESSLQYVSDGDGLDYWQTIAESEYLGKGDCEDMALLLYAKLEANGYDPDLCMGIGTMESDSLHMWVELKMDGIRYVLDPTSHAMFQKREVDKYIRFPNYSFEFKLSEWRERNNE